MLKPLKFSQSFTRFGPHRGFLLWCSFKASLKEESWPKRAAKLNGSLSPLDEWLSALPSRFSWFLQLPMVVCLVLGALVMAGALSYSGGRPVNLWLLILIFCVLPFVMTLISAVTAIRLNTAKVGTPPLHTQIYSWLLNKTSGHTLTLIQSASAPAWAMWQAQLLAIAFHVAAMMTLWGVLFFNDVAFGWSSTIIEDVSIVARIFEIFCLPWSGITPPPDYEAVQASQFFYHSSSPLDTVVASGNAWWPHVLFGMFFYGLAPRILLCAWLKWRTRLQLAQEINNSADVQVFLNACNKIVSQHVKKLPSVPHDESQSFTIGAAFTGAKVSDLSLDALVQQCPENTLAWQYEPEATCRKVLGLDTWAQDSQWLKSASFNPSFKILIVVSIVQTPTAELGDVLALLPEEKQLLLILPSSQHVGTGQVKSWQYFANEHGISYELINVVQPGLTEE